MKTVVILNSPPESGKDTIANLLHKQLLKAKVLEFKEGLYEETANHYAIDLNYLKFITTDRKYKDTLDSSASRQVFVGWTPREALIHVSETVIKPSKGADYFGVLAAAKLEKGVNIFSDGGGWWDELLPVSQAADKVIICRLHRQGYNFDNDSRNYYKKPVPEGTNITICDIDLVTDNPMAAVDAIRELIKC